MSNIQKVSQLNTHDIIKIRLIKMINSPVYFMKEYCYIQHPKQGRIKFNLYDFQEDVLTDISQPENKFNIILKARQMGISTLIAGYVLWLIMFHRDKNVLIVAIKLDVAQNLLSKIRTMYDNLPQWLKDIYPLVRANTTEMSFTTGSKVKSSPMTDEAGRSESLSLLIIDEMAFIPKIDKLWTAISPTLSTGGSAIMLSTPNGMGNLFHKIWLGAENGENGFNHIKLHWSLHPDRGEDFAKEFIQKLGYRQFGQEYGCDFVASGNTFIDTEILSKLKTIDPIEKRGYGKELWIWKHPDYTVDYILTADVARGDGSDYSAFHVIDMVSNEQVAEFKGKIGTKEYANILVAIATEYNNAVLVIENNSIGWAVIQQVIDLGYKKLYYSYKEFGAIDPDTYFEQNYDLVDKSKMKPGFTMSVKTRPLVLSKLDIYFKDDELIIHSKRLVNELFMFLWLNGKPQAQSGYNDDLVMSIATGLFVRDTALLLRNKGMDITRQTLNAMNRTNLQNKYTLDTVYQADGQKNPYIHDMGGEETDLRDWI